MNYIRDAEQKISAFGNLNCAILSPALRDSLSSGASSCRAELKELAVFPTVFYNYRRASWRGYEMTGLPTKEVLQGQRGR